MSDAKDGGARSAAAGRDQAGGADRLFGQVIDGLDVVKRLEAAGLASGTPKASVKMETVTVAES